MQVAGYLVGLWVVDLLLVSYLDVLLGRRHGLVLLALHL